MVREEWPMNGTIPCMGDIEKVYVSGLLHTYPNHDLTILLTWFSLCY